VSLGLDANTGGVLPVTGSGMVFKVRLEMLVSDDGGSTYVPHLNYYDAAPTPPEAISSYSDYTIAFYWENDPPELENSATVNVDEGDTTIITGAVLKANDLESQSANIVFVLDPKKEGTAPHHGKVSRSGIDLLPGNTFTMEDINNELISYIHDGGESTADSIPFMIEDGDGAKYRNGSDSVFFLKVNITPVDDPPSLAKNLGMTLDEGSTLAVSDDMLLTTDPESSDQKVTYTLDPAGNSDLPLHGLLKLNNVPISDGATFTQADIHNGNLVYQHDGSESVSDGFVFQVTDEFGHLAEVNGNSEFTFEITVIPVNDLPIISVNEGMVVIEAGSHVITSAMLRTTDAESNDQSITYTLDPAGNSEYPAHGLLLLNNNPLGDGSTFTQDDINNGLLAYQHDGSESLLDGFAFSVADASGGVAGNGNTAFFEITITPVNDLPVVSVNEGMTVIEAGSNVITSAMLRTTDAESSDLSITYTLDPAGNSEYPAHGLMLLNNSPLGDGSTFTQDDINNGRLVYQHDGTESLLDGFVFSVADSSGGVAGSGSTAFFEITITPVNDPPVISMLNPLEVGRGSEVVITNQFLAVTDAESSANEITFTLDPDHNIDNPSAGTLKLNGTSLSDGQTFTQADINNGLLSYANNGSASTSDFFPFSAADPNGGIVSDGGHTVFHLNFIITGPTALIDASAKHAGLFTLYPNPVRDEIQLTFSEKASGRVSLKLFNGNGEKIWEGQKEAGEKYSIPLTGYPNGVYYLKAESNKESLTVKFIKK
jgi:hypothetical protein